MKRPQHKKRQRHSDPLNVGCNIFLELPGKLVALALPLRKSLRSRSHAVLHRVRQRKGVRVFALGQQIRCFADHVAHTAGEANGNRVRQWF